MNIAIPREGSSIVNAAIFAGWLRHMKQNVPKITHVLTPTKIVWNVLERRFKVTLLRLAVHAAQYSRPRKRHEQAEPP
jgi:hypothetical protein